MENYTNQCPNVNLLKYEEIHDETLHFANQIDDKLCLWNMLPLDCFGQSNFAEKKSKKIAGVSKICKEVRSKNNDDESLNLIILFCNFGWKVSTH